MEYLSGEVVKWQGGYPSKAATMLKDHKLVASVSLVQIMTSLLTASVVRASALDSGWSNQEGNNTASSGTIES